MLTEETRLYEMNLLPGALQSSTGLVRMILIYDPMEDLVKVHCAVLFRTPSC